VLWKRAWELKISNLDQPQRAPRGPEIIPLVTFRQLLHGEFPKPPKLVAGASGQDKPVVDTHILGREATNEDLPEVASRILILDSINLGDNTYQIDVLIRKASDSDASALLIINLRAPIGFTALRLANKLQIPLVTIQGIDALQLADEIRRVVRAPFIARSDAILRVTEKFRKAPRNSDLAYALKIIADELHGRAALLGINRTEIVTSDGGSFVLPKDLILREGSMTESNADRTLLFQPLMLAPGERPNFWIATELLSPREAWIQVAREVLNFSSWYFSSRLIADRLVQERDARFRLGVLNAITATKEFAEPVLIGQLGILGWRVDGWCTAIYMQSVGDVDSLRILNGAQEFRQALVEIGFIGPVVERPDGFSAWQVEKTEPQSSSFTILLEKFVKLLSKLEHTSPGLQNFIGIGRPYQGILGLQKSLAEAKESCTIAQLSGKNFDVQHIDEMGIRRILLGWYASESFSDFAITLLSPIQKADNDGELLRTLETYLNHNCSPSETAEMLQIHRNTVLNRMDKIKSLLRVDLNQPDERLALQLACRVIKKRRDLSS
jgi:hypothetical protein